MPKNNPIFKKNNLRNWRWPQQIALFLCVVFPITLVGILTQASEGHLQLSRHIYGIILALSLVLALVSLLIFDLAMRYPKNYSKTNEKFEESKNLYEDLIQEAPDPIITLDSLGFIQSANRAVEQLSGYSAQELLGKHFIRLGILSSSSINKVLREFTLIMTGQKRPPFELSLIRKDKTLLQFEVNTHPLRDHCDNISRIQVIFRDITERKHLEDQLRQSQKMDAVGRLAGGIAHDFNNLLTVINGTSEYCIQSLAVDNPLRGDFQEILGAGKRATALVGQLLAFSRRQVFQPKVFNVNELAKQMEKMLRRLVPENIQFLTLFAQDLGAVKMDPSYFGQVLMNLVVNARDAMPTGGKLLIETKNITLDETYASQHVDVLKGEYILLAVSDTGVGMNAEVKSRLFEPFFTTKEKGKGTGLGLATSYGIVKQNGGTIEVYSEPGRGTSFKVYLPRVYDAVESLFAQESFQTLPNGTETVLLVEDDSSVRKFASRVLENQGYQVLQASDGQEALKMIKSLYEKKIHIVITDIIMPAMGGRELVDEIRRFHPDIKSVFTSGYMENFALYQNALQNGESFLQKPFSPHALIVKIQEVLANNVF